MAEVMTPQFWTGLLTIIWINIILSGDNAVVIALAARSLPEHQQKKAVFWGAGAAVIMRIILTIVAVELLKLPYLKLIGGVLLLWIAVKLLMPEDDGDDGIESSSNLWGAIKTILIADLVMSLDNVIGVAAAAKGSIVLLVLGLADQHSAGDLRRHHADEADGAFSGHHHHRRRHPGLGRRRDGGHRSGPQRLGECECRMAALGGARCRRGVRRSSSANGWRRAWRKRQKAWWTLPARSPSREACRN